MCWHPTLKTPEKCKVFHPEEIKDPGTNPDVASFWAKDENAHSRQKG